MAGEDVDGGMGRYDGDGSDALPFDSHKVAKSAKNPWLPMKSLQGGFVQMPALHLTESASADTARTQSLDLNRPRPLRADSPRPPTRSLPNSPTVRSPLAPPSYTKAPNYQQSPRQPNRRQERSVTIV